MASPISSKTRECLKLFAQVAESTKELGLSTERNRFDKWSRNIGAHQKGSSSLDQRLQDASHIRDVVVELLDGLLDSLTQVVEKFKLDEPKNIQSPESDSEISQDELEESIHIIISSLLKLAIAVRNPAPVDRYIKSRAIDMSFYKSHDLAYLEELFPGIDGYLKERMAEATLQRRRFLEYSARHHFKLARDSSPDETEEEGDDAASLYAETTASSLPAPLRRESSTLEAAFDTRSERSSFTSYASSGMGTRPKVPPPPADAVLGGDPFECPYCRLLISPQDTYNWKKHVFHDLQPYVCTFEKCEDSDHLYRGRHEWFDHELAMHRREWVCPGHCDEVFGSQEPFETHLAAHYAESAGASLTTLIKTCERPTLPSASVQCPFCLEKVVSRKKIRNHIGQHLTDISLRVLPTTLEETESSENEPQNGSTDSEHTTDEKIPMSAARDSLQEALEDLTIRVQDWKGHKVNSFGKLLFHGSYGVLTRKSQAVPKNYEIYLFEKILLCCKPMLIPTKKKWYRRDKNNRPTQKPELQVKGRIFMTNITGVLRIPRSGMIEIFWQGDLGIENFILDLRDEATAFDTMIAIQQRRLQRRLNAESETEIQPSSFAWLQDETVMANPYAHEKSDDDSRDEFSTNLPGLAASSVHSRTSSMGVRKEHIRAASGATEAEFEAALDAAVEAAYDDGSESMDKPELNSDDDDEIVAKIGRKVELAKERVRQDEREAAIQDARERERERKRLLLNFPLLPSQIKAKVAYGDNHLTLVISRSISYVELILRIDDKLTRFSKDSISNEQLKLRWRDEDGDLVNISNDEDLQLAITEEFQRSRAETELKEMNFVCVLSSQADSQYSQEDPPESGTNRIANIDPEGRGYSQNKNESPDSLMTRPKRP